MEEIGMDPCWEKSASQSLKQNSGTQGMMAQLRRIRMTHFTVQSPLNFEGWLYNVVNTFDKDNYISRLIS
jgi:hypothetical protein